MSSARIIKRQLTAAEAQDFSHEITLTPNIVGYRPAELMKLEDVLVIEASGRPVGILSYVETGRFIDLKLLLIKEGFRGKGYGKQLIERALKSFGSTKPVYSVTRNPIVAKQLKESGFKIVRFHELPIACQLHQARMAFSLYRIKEFARKLYSFPHEPRFEYYIKPQQR